MAAILSGVASVVIPMATIVVLAYWMYRLAKWDGSDKCDETQCDTCPFPCEKHKK